MYIHTHIHNDTQCPQSKHEAVGGLQLQLDWGFYGQLYYILLSSSQILCQASVSLLHGVVVNGRLLTGNVLANSEYVLLHSISVKCREEGKVQNDHFILRLILT